MDRSAGHIAAHAEAFSVTIAAHLVHFGDGLIVRLAAAHPGSGKPGQRPDNITISAANLPYFLIRVFL